MQPSLISTARTPATTTLLAALTLAMASASPALAGSSDHARMISGEILVEATLDGRIVAVVDTAGPDAAADGVADHVFVLQLAAKPATTLSLGPVPATLLYRDDSLLITTEDDDAVLLTLVPPGDSARIPAGAVRFEGFGLSHRSGDLSALSVDPSPRGLLYHLSRPEDGESFEPDRPLPAPGVLCPDGGGGVYCTSGGCGANQCELSTGTITCSVTCNTGYFACCNQGGSCKCYNDSPCTSC